MIRDFQLRVLPGIAASDIALKDYMAKSEGIDRRTVCALRILRRSIDARQRTVYINLKVRAYLNEQPKEEEYEHVEYPSVEGKSQVIVVGEGPGGLFASLRLIELGLRPIVLERGKDVHERKKDMALITKTQKVDPESNYCFGEGGAGAFSDGKLYTRSKKRGSTEKILRVFCQHGAPTDILMDAHPHIGTDKLPRIIENMRLQIIRSGGEVHFETKMTGLLTEGDKVVGVKAVDGQSGTQLHFHGPVILATGHSARDIYRYLHEHKVEMEVKGIAMGVRLEHPARLIDQMQYHSRQGRGRYLPAAEYSMVTQVEGRGVYSFCMCPGGYVIPAATATGQLVVNGMSPSNRGTQWSNSGMVVEIRPEDIPTIDRDGEEDNVLKMMHFQEHLEHDCWLQGNRRQTAPAQRMDDFVKGRQSYDLPKSSYAPGLISSPLHFWMPPFIVKRLQQGFLEFDRRHHGFLTHEAVLIAAETRTSSPVRIVRDPTTLQHVRFHGLFPCGEGAGYAGGIVSAGIDGERCAEECAAYVGRIGQKKLS